MIERFPFLAGSLAFCFVDTVGARGSDDREKLVELSDLEDWLRQADIVQLPPGVVTPQDLVVAKQLREAIHRGGDRLINGRTISTNDILFLNAAADVAPPRPKLRIGGLVFTATEPVRAAFSAIAADALCWFATAAGRIRRCPDCAMMFLDTSRAGRRRWCSSSTNCGNRAKVRSHRARKAARP